MSNTAHTKLGPAALLLIGGERIGYATVSELARCCSNEVPPVASDCCGPSISHTVEIPFFPTDEELRFFDSLTVRNTQEVKVREWTAEDVEYKKMAWEAQQPKHRSPYTKPQGPTPKARKAARRRAKAGRKAAR